MARRPRINLKVAKRNGKVQVRIKGHLDASGVSEVMQTLQHIHGQGKTEKLVIDFSGVRCFEYFGIATLSRVIRNQRRQFQHVELAGLQSSKKDLFRHFGIETFS